MSEDPKKFVEYEQFGLKVRAPVDREEEKPPPPATRQTTAVMDVQPQHYHHHQQPSSPATATAATMYESSQRPIQSTYRATTNATTDGRNAERQEPTSSNLNHRVSTVVASNLSDLPPPPHVDSREPTMEFSVANEFGEMVAEPITPTKPLVVLDCANLGWMYGGGKGFEPTGIEIALAFFSSFPAITVVAFIPAHYLKKKPRDGTPGIRRNACMETHEWEMINRMVLSGAVTVVPAGDHDDVYILSYARAHNGYVISNDHFVDHIKGLENESIKMSMILWLRMHRGGYTYIRDQFMLNPGCSLAVLLGYMQGPGSGSGPGRDDGSDDGGSMKKMLDQALNLSIRLNKHYQTRQLLLARAMTFLEQGIGIGQQPTSILEAAEDLKLVLSFDPNCVEARKLMMECENRIRNLHGQGPGPGQGPGQGQRLGQMQGQGHVQGQGQMQGQGQGSGHGFIPGQRQDLGYEPGQGLGSGPGQGQGHSHGQRPGNEIRRGPSSQMSPSTYTVNRDPNIPSDDPRYDGMERF